MGIWSDLTESKVFTFLGKISVLHWTITIIPGLVSGIGAAMHGKPIEVVILYSVGACALTLVVLHYGRLEWEKHHKGQPSTVQRRYSRLWIPALALMGLVAFAVYHQYGNRRLVKIPPPNESTPIVQPIPLAKPIVAKNTPTEIRVLPGVGRAKVRKTKKAPSAIQQSNSGGTNVQQATTGNNSPIVNSPVSINADRELTDNAANKLEAALRGHTAIVYFSCVGGSAEGQNLARQLQAAVSTVLGWTSQLGASDEITGYAVHGIEVQAPAGQEAAADALVSGLNSVGLEAHRSKTPYTGGSVAPLGAINVEIGSKQ
ncbi:MAG TPA: hypothetical protein VMV59_02100 [Candidatus Dormibacteraeota bacterium]|nr:hypothetical protein [Candidatus Dormibacteraeota bacterium]